MNLQNTHGLGGPELRKEICKSDGRAAFGICNCAKALYASDAKIAAKPFICAGSIAQRAGIAALQHADEDVAK